MFLENKNLFLTIGLVVSKLRVLSDLYFEINNLNLIDFLKKLNFLNCF